MEDMLSRKIGSSQAMVEDCHVDMFVVYAQKKNEEVTATPPGARSGNCLPDHGYRKAPSCCPSLQSRQSDRTEDFYRRLMEDMLSGKTCSFRAMAVKIQQLNQDCMQGALRAKEGWPFRSTSNAPGSPSIALSIIARQSEVSSKKFRCPVLNDRQLVNIRWRPAKNFTANTCRRAKLSSLF